MTRSARDKSGPAQTRASAAGVFDEKVALAAVDGDMELLEEVVNTFIEEYPALLLEIRKAVNEKDAERLRRCAHTLKGLTGNFGSYAVPEAALKLELMGKRGETAVEGEVLDALDAEAGRLEAALKEFAEG